MPRIRTALFCGALLLGIGLPSKIAFGQEFRSLVENSESSLLSRERDTEADREDEPLETDRDSFTPATNTVGLGRLLFESSYSFIDNRNSANNHSFPEILTRFGLSDNLELRLGWNYEVGGGGSISHGHAGEAQEASGSREESQMLYGLKLALTDQQDWMPQSACIIQGTTPTSGPKTTSDFQLGYVFGWKVLEDWRLDSSLRYVSTSEEGDHFNQWAPSIVLKVPVAERWNVHGEYFGIFTHGRNEARNGQFFSPGLHYLLSPDFEVGVRVGWGLNDDAANFFSNVGLGLRF